MSKPLRALLLAAGLGTRLKPLTLHTPKCLVPIGGKPLLSIWLHKLEAAGCEAALVNTHHLADQVMEFVLNWQSSTMSIQLMHEPSLLGTAGTLMASQAFFQGSTGLLIHADNAMADDLSNFLIAHGDRPSDCFLTMLTFHTSTPSSCGIVETNAKGVVTAFHEKVEDPPGNKANGAVYLFEQELFGILKTLKPGISDFSGEVLPNLLGRIYTWHTNSHYLDIGTLDSLQKAQSIWLKF